MEKCSEVIQAKADCRNYIVPSGNSNLVEVAKMFLGVLVTYRLEMRAWFN